MVGRFPKENIMLNALMRIGKTAIGMKLANDI